MTIFRFNINRACYQEKWYNWALIIYACISSRPTTATSTSTDADYEKKQWCKKFDKRQPPKSRQYPQDAAYSLIPPQRSCECGRSRGVTISRGILVRKRQLARTVNYLKLTSSTTSQILRSTYATNNDGNPSHHFLSTFCLVFIIIIFFYTN